MGSESTSQYEKIPCLTQVQIADETHHWGPISAILRTCFHTIQNSGVKFHYSVISTFSPKICICYLIIFFVFFDRSNMYHQVYEILSHGHLNSHPLHIFLRVLFLLQCAFISSSMLNEIVIKCFLYFDAFFHIFLRVILSMDQNIFCNEIFYNLSLKCVY